MNDFVQSSSRMALHKRGVVTYSLDSGSVGSDWVSSGSIGNGSVSSGYGVQGDFVRRISAERTLAAQGSNAADSRMDDGQVSEKLETTIPFLGFRADLLTASVQSRNMATADVMNRILTTIAAELKRNGWSSRVANSRTAKNPITNATRMLRTTRNSRVLLFSKEATSRVAPDTFADKSSLLFMLSRFRFLSSCQRLMISNKTDES
jgi:hypothetical protein